MTQNFKIYLLLSCLFLSTGIVSCHKTETLSTPSSKLVGKWKQVRYATDDNANGQIDDWEIKAVDKSATNSIEFKKDSTGIESGTFSPDLPFSWMITGELSLMTIYNTGDTFLYKVTLVNAAHLYLTTKTKFGLAGYYYDTEK
jgi:hypothetical protein